jgi:hypothetical protein
MKKSALLFVLLTTILGACSTSKSASASDTGNQARPEANTSTTPQAIATKSGKTIPSTKTEALMGVPERPLVRKKSDKTVEQMFDAATVKRDSF